MNWFCSCTWHWKVVSTEKLPDYVNILVKIDEKSSVMLWYKIESEYPDDKKRWWEDLVTWEKEFWMWHLLEIISWEKLD